MSVFYYIDVIEPGRGPARSVRVTGKAIRIGSGLVCDLRLRCVALAPVECVLRWDGSAWTICPIAHESRVWVRGRLISRSEQLAANENFQIGDCELRIQPVPTLTETAADGSRSAPFDARPTPRTLSTVPAPVARIDPTFASRAPSAPSRPASIEPRASNLAPPPPLRAPANLRTPAPSREPIRSTFSQRPLPTLRPLPTTRPPREPHNAAKQLTAISSPALDTKCRVPQPPTASASIQAASKNSSAALSLASAPNPELPGSHQNPSANTTAAPQEAVSANWLDADDLAGRQAWDDSDAQTPATLLVAHDFTHAGEVAAEVAANDGAKQAPSAPVRPSIENSAFETQHAAPRFQATLLESDSSETAPPPDAEIVATSDRPPDQEPGWQSPSETLPDEVEVPAPLSDEAVVVESVAPCRSAEMILAAHRVSRETAPPQRRSRSTRHPMPTAPRAPAVYTVRNRAVLSLFLISAIVCAIGGIGIASLWIADNAHAGATISQLRQGAQVIPGSAPAPPPVNAWWATTPAHAYTADESMIASQRPTVERSAAIGPLDPSIQYSTNALNASAVNSDAPLYRPSRDILCLVEAARQRFALNQDERASEILRDAYALAVGVSIDAADTPRLDAEPPSRRAWLPNEELFVPINALLIEQELDSVERLTSVVPAFGPAWLSLARSLQGNLQLQASILDHMRTLPADPPDGASTAVHRAALAEALALQNNLDDAADLYERVLTLPRSSPWAALYLLNLSDIQTRRHDTDAARAALHQATREARRPSAQSASLKRLIESATPASGKAAIE